MLDNTLFWALIYLSIGVFLYGMQASVYENKSETDFIRYLIISMLIWPPVVLYRLGAWVSKKIRL